MLHMFIVNQHQNNSRDGNRTLQSPIPVFVGVFTVLTIQHHRKKGIEFRTDALSSEVPTPNSNEDPIYRSRKLHGCGDWDAHRSAEDLRIQGTQPRPQRRRVQLWGCRCCPRIFRDVNIMYIYSFKYTYHVCIEILYTICIYIYIHIPYVYIYI